MTDYVRGNHVSQYGGATVYHSCMEMELDGGKEVEVEEAVEEKVEVEV
jgi:hypothetical protein